MIAIKRLPQERVLPETISTGVRCDQCEDWVCMGACPDQIEVTSVVAYFRAAEKMPLRWREKRAVEYADAAIEEAYA